MEYDESKKSGDIIENEILKILKLQDKDAYIDDRGKANSDWDIYLPNLKFGVEVKGDYMANHTGNLVVEIIFDDKPSALSKTKAKWWVFVEGHRFIWIRPLHIYQFLSSNWEKYKSPAYFKGDGDSKYKYAYLVKRKEFVMYVTFDLKDDEGFIKEIPKSHILHEDNFTKNFGK